MTQKKRNLLHKHESLSSDPQYPGGKSKQTPKPDMVVDAWRQSWEDPRDSQAIGELQVQWEAFLKKNK